MNCDINALAAKGAAFNSFSLNEFQSAKVYLLAQILKTLEGKDYTDINALAGQMRPYESLPDYAQRSAFLQLLADMLDAMDVHQVMTTEQFASAIATGRCVTPDSMKKAEIYLWCQLLSNVGPQ